MLWYMVSSYPRYWKHGSFAAAPHVVIPWNGARESTEIRSAVKKVAMYY
jgi:hypothetical protein